MGHGYGDLLLSGRCKKSVSTSAIISSLSFIIPNNLAVNGARDAVLELQIHLRDRVFRIDRGIRDIT